jgi:NADPH-dependent curcumin reductase CurA
LARQLAAACPKGIDVYFENVGGVVFDRCSTSEPACRCVA